MGSNLGNVHFKPVVTKYPAERMPVWIEVEERKLAGGTVSLIGLPKGTQIPLALPVYLPVMGGKAIFLDSYEVQEAVTAASTSIKLKGTNNAVPEEGFILGILNDAGNGLTKAAALGAYDAENGSFAIEANALGALNKGDKLYVAKAAGSNVALQKPTGLSWREIYVSNDGAYAGTVAVVTKGQILGDRIPEMLDFYKDALTGITFEYENE